MSAALALVACAPAPAGPIKIGGLAPLTGPQSTFGEGARLGTGIAVRDINAAGGVLGRPLEIVMRDDEANPTKAVQAVQELVSNEKVSALIGPINTPSALAVAAPVGEAKLIDLQITTGTATVDPQKSPTIFRPQYYASQEANVMLDYALKTLGKKCPGILADSTGYGQGGVAELKASLDARGVKPCGEDQRYNSGEVDMTGQLSRIIASNADVILAWGLGHELANAALGLQKLGSPLKMVGASGITTVGFRALSKDAGAGHVGVYSRRFSAGDGAPADARALNFVDQLDRFASGSWEAQTIVS
ncbi:MAG: ABC transporter substrate-binding protein, partial [Chloroflexi bacterium]|nr:ABC transporter substrate-binding protein [Chloroflexota bacterium]